MRDYWAYIQGKKKTLTLIGVALILFGVGSEQLIPYLMRQWSYDRAYGVLHIGLGIILSGGGIILLLYLIKSRWPNKQWKKQVGVIALWYLAVELLIGILQGGAGLLLFRLQLFSYEEIKLLLYITAAIVQNLIRVFFLFVLLEIYFEAQWREDVRFLRNAEIASILLSVFSVGIACLPHGVVQMVVNVIWETVYLLGFTAYFGYRR